MSTSPDALGRPRVHLRRTDSTNERARALALAGAPHGTLVSAAEQTAGRGRQGRRWSAPAGSALLASLLLRNPPALLPLAAALAVCDVAGAEAHIKWPNDIVVPRATRVAQPAAGRREGGAAGHRPPGGWRSRPQAAGRVAQPATGRQAGPLLFRQPGPSSSDSRPPLQTAEPLVSGPTLAKLAGILIEGRPQEGWAVLGIGLNVAVRVEELPGELRDTAATLGRSPEEIEPLLARLLAALGQRLGEPAAQVLEAWRARDALRGREVSWATGHGRAEGVDGEGRLVVWLPDGSHTTLDAGEVHLAPGP